MPDAEDRGVVELMTVGANASYVGYEGLTVVQLESCAGSDPRALLSSLNEAVSCSRLLVRPASSRLGFILSAGWHGLHTFIRS